MVVPNAKYGNERHGAGKNRDYPPESGELDKPAAVDLSSFEIPRYQELIYLDPIELEE